MPPYLFYKNTSCLNWSFDFFAERVYIAFVFYYILTHVIKL